MKEDDPRSPRFRAVAALIAADVMRLASEFPAYDTDIILELFRILAATTGRRPDYLEVRDQLEGYAGSIPGDQLRRILGMPERVRDPPVALVPPRHETVRAVQRVTRPPGRPRGSTRTIRDDDEYRARWQAYLDWCGRDRRPTITGFATWTGDGRHWPLSTIKDYRRRALDRGSELPG